MLPSGGKAPAIDRDTLREGGRDVDSLAYALRSGVTPSGDAFGGAMGEMVLYGTQYLSDADLGAMATYLLEDPGVIPRGQDHERNDR